MARKSSKYLINTEVYTEPTDTAKTAVQAHKCPACGDTLFSRANHDFRTCSCGALSVDAGFSGYGGRLCWNDKFFDSPAGFILYVVPTQRELYQDWSGEIDKFGRIPGEPEPNKLKSFGINSECSTG